MKLAALLSFHNEDPAWLADCVHSLSYVGASDVIALDGSYEHFPGARGHGSWEEAKAIISTARQVGIRPWVYRPAEPWPTEMDKRSALFRRADTLGADWYFVIDADEAVLEARPDLHAQLEELEEDAAEVKLREPIIHGGNETVVMTSVIHEWRMFFRAIPGIRVVGNHCSYLTPDGRLLWGDDGVVSAGKVDVLVEHRNNLREPKRRQDAQTYYQTRHREKLETRPVVS